MYAVYIGSQHPAAHIEFREARFIVANSIEETHGELGARWWHTSPALHIDCRAEIDHADGYGVELRSERFSGRERLFFANLGGDDPADFAEQHRSMLMVADYVTEAKAWDMATIPD